MPTDLEKKTAEAIVNIFETSRALGDYANVTVVSGDPGHLTYGRSQTTLASGNLFLLIKGYVEANAAQFGPQLQPFLTRLQDRDLSLDHDLNLRSLLQQAGSDPVMHDVQDSFFDRVYWTPALASATGLGITSALGCCVVYDSKVHGSWALMRDRTNTQFGLPGGIGENSWIGHYVAVRREWLANNSIFQLRKTVYRMDELGRLIGANNWALDLPIVVRGITLDAMLLSGSSVRASAQIVEEMLLSLRNPMLRGDDVHEVQEALNSNGFPLVADGIFGSATDKAVRDFQSNRRLVADGIVGPATRAELGLQA